MDYNARNKIQDDVIKIPADGSSFIDMEENGLTLKKNHVILGFLWQQMVLIHLHRWDPFTQMRSIYTVWPIFVTNNNIPPWFLIKRDHIMLLMIIPSILCLQLFLLMWWHLICRILFPNVIYIFLFFSCAWFIYLNGTHNYIFYMFKSIR